MSFSNLTKVTKPNFCTGHKECFYFLLSQSMCIYVHEIQKLGEPEAGWESEERSLGKQEPCLALQEREGITEEVGLYTQKGELMRTHVRVN